MRTILFMLGFVAVSFTLTQKTFAQSPPEMYCLHEEKDGYQSAVDIDVISDGSYAAVWKSGESIYARVFNADESPRFKEVKVSEDHRVIFPPHVVMHEDGSFVVAYMRYQRVNGSTLNELYMRRYDKDGNALGNLSKVNTKGSLSYYFDITMNSTGSFRFAYVENIKTGEGSLFTRLYSADGVPEAPFELYTKYAGSNEISIDMNSDGNYIVAYRDNFLNNLSVLCRKPDNTNLSWARKSISGSATLPKVIMGTDIDFTIMWTSLSADKGFIIRRYNRLGNRLYSSLVAGDNIYKPDFVRDGVGNCFLVYQEDNQITCAKYGSSLNFEFKKQISNLPQTSNRSPKIGIDRRGNLVAAWDVNTNKTDIYARRIMLSPNSGPTGITISGDGISENNQKDALIGQLICEDPNLFDEYNFYLRGASDEFELRGDKLYAKKAFNYEALKKFTGVFSAYIRNGVEHIDNASVEILVKDVNEAPEFTQTPAAQLNLFENTDWEFIVEAVDPDNADNVSTDADWQNLTYQLAQGPQGMQIDENTGVLTWRVVKSANANEAVRISVSDGVNQVDYNFQIQIQERQAPTDILLSGNHTLAENNAVNLAVGSLTSTDTDANDSFTYEILNIQDADGNNLAPNASFFTIGGNEADQLLASKAYNYEEGTQYTVNIRSTDSYKLSFEKSFVISIENQNEAPTKLSFQGNLNFDENNLVDEELGSFSAADQDANDALSFSIQGVKTDNNQDLANWQNYFALEGADHNKLIIKKAVNYEEFTSFVLNVRVSDKAGLYEEKDFSFTVKNVNEKPSSLSYTGDTSFEENNSVDAELGYFTAHDPEGNQGLQFSIVELRNDKGEVVNQPETYFTLSADADPKLVLKRVFKYAESKFYTIDIKVQDADGLNRKASFRFEINEAQATSVDAIDESSFRVYPNPFTEDLFISADNANNLRVEFYDLRGVLQHAEEFSSVSSSDNNRINLPSLKPGIYFIHIKSADLDKIVKLIKSR